MAKVSARLRIEFGSAEEASDFFRAFYPDFIDLKPEIIGNEVSIEIEDRPARVRAIINSVLRLVHLYDSLSEFLKI
jgi:tRNA threonylcarbamoyladenosine modification (KEOPS) complex  Pcc1 subunit